MAMHSFYLEGVRDTLKHILKSYGLWFRFLKERHCCIQIALLDDKERYLTIRRIKRKLSIRIEGVDLPGCLEEEFALAESCERWRSRNLSLKYSGLLEALDPFGDENGMVEAVWPLNTEGECG